MGAKSGPNHDMPTSSLRSLHLEDGLAQISPVVLESFRSVRIPFFSSKKIMESQIDPASTHGSMSFSQDLHVPMSATLSGIVVSILEYTS